MLPLNEAIIEVRMKKVLLFVVIGLLLLAIPATIFFLGQQRDIRAKAAPATTLSLTPLTNTVNVGDSFKLDVTMTPASNQVVSAQIYLTFDPTKLKATAFTNGSNAPNVLNSAVLGNGTASISVGAASNAQPITTAGSIAQITFTALAATTAIAPTEVQFASNTFVSGINDTTANVLNGTAGSKITINGPTVTPTPTPTTTITATPTVTITPTLTPTQAASQSGEATSSAVTIASPTTNQDVASTEPVIQGKAPPGSSVTIVIHSTPQTVVVTADADGNWTYTPTTPLDNGPHDVTASVLDAAGTTQTASTSFVVAAGTGQGGGVSSETAMPVSGSVGSTIVLISLGLVLLAAGALIPVFIR